MRIVARSTLVAFWTKHPETESPLNHWLSIARAARWSTMNDVQKVFPKAKVLNAERVRFAVHGGDYRLIVAFDFRRQVAFIKFVGSHADYDRVDALTVARY